MTASHLPPVRPSVEDDPADPALEAARDAQAAVHAAGTPLSALATQDDDDDTENQLETLVARVVLEDGTEWTVPVLNRDFVAWDLTRPKKKWPAAEEAPFLLNNFLAWTASKRDGREVGTFETFVVAADLVKLTRGDAARPTR